MTKRAKIVYVAERKNNGEVLCDPAGPIVEFNFVRASKRANRLWRRGTWSIVSFRRVGDW